MMSGEAQRSEAVYPHDDLAMISPSCPDVLPRQHFLRETDRIVRSGQPSLDAALAEMLARMVTSSTFLQGITVASAAQTYARTLIFSSDDYCVLAIVWRPGQMSPVHSHRTWCALGVHAGTLTETYFEPAGHVLEQGLRVSGCRQLHAGSTSHGAAGDQTAHRMANLGVEPAVSVHVYGTAFERLGATLNQIWAE